MKKLIWGVMSLVLATNFAQAQSNGWEGNKGVKLAILTPLRIDLQTAPISPEPLPVPLDGAQEGVQDDQSDPVRTKTFSKSFAMGASDKLNLSNKYGDVLIKIWDKREVRVDVEIKAYSSQNGEAQRLLDETTIEAGKTGDLISFKTNMGNRDGNYGSRVRNGKIVWKREVKVNYVVYMPTSNCLSMSTQYGNMTMGNFSGPLYAKVQYGNFTAGNLNSNNNYISVQYGKADVEEVNVATIKQQYGSGLTIGTVGTLDLNAQYVGVNIQKIRGNATVKQQYGSGLTIGSVDNLELDVQYANVTLGTINGNANVKQQYNNISISSVNKLNLKAEYANVKLGSLKGDGSFKLSYNKLNIDNVGAGCRNLSIDADYAGVALGFGTGYHADFDLKTEYGKFKPGPAVYRTVQDEDNKKQYSGKIGNGGASKINIKTDYGSVTFN
ncbi:hypothetical protein SAMN05421820_109103 [Pedobacter steynii]|uniref:Adhesin domain-containing protein n=1 Tax=Pedobacter steynii TaxID=430522 RepID=A0A1H0DU28_9SPHI|nr:hypothetical protein [Pedobacter steynii]NQX41837.1 hypothetical protein [Pedobacter steynii]SDN73660.1 hypothetical protein SAMN05421820_109103 [Pedobacter steynii]